MQAQAQGYERIQYVFKTSGCLAQGERAMLRISRGQSIQGLVSHVKEFEPHSVAVIFGVFSKKTTWFALQKNHPGRSSVCDGWEGSKLEAERSIRGLLQKTR